MSELYQSIYSQLHHSQARAPEEADLASWRAAVVDVLRQRIVPTWLSAQRRSAHSKQVYYLSMEFLLGRLLEDAANNLGLRDALEHALQDAPFSFEQIIADEPDPALGNGGLGRLAACFLESMASVGCAGAGYGLRFEHGLFRQQFCEGAQQEYADQWLSEHSGWEFPRPERRFHIGFGGSVSGEWQPEHQLIATPTVMPIAGWSGGWASTLRLWQAQPVEGFDFARFNHGDFAGASDSEREARDLCRVLYPNDSNAAGKSLRLKQEYLLVSASLQEILWRFSRVCQDWLELPQRVAIQLNDTHPALAGPELVRLLHDVHGVALQSAIEISQQTLHYTNHTLLPEALECWSTWLFGNLLPRHMQLVEAIEDWQSRQTGRRSIIRDHQVHMGDLAFVMARRVNGVSALHTDLVTSTVFADLHADFPDRIVNQTNGITPRRWLHSANPRLSGLISERIGDTWVADLETLEQLEPHIDTGFCEQLSRVKRDNKIALAQSLGLALNPDAIFDTQAKRFHEYKRQLLNVLETIALWQAMHESPNAAWTPRVKIFAGKAAPGYAAAKQVIQLVHDVARVINNDPVTQQWLQVVFPENYNVSLAERLIPATDVSEQISTAGTEASGTGNMKFALNGALTVGTLDGANVEIRERVGAENFFLFGLQTDAVAQRRAQPQRSRAIIESSERLSGVLQLLAEGYFCRLEPGRYHDLVHHLWHHDYYLVGDDFDSYYDCQRLIDTAYNEQTSWQKMAALNISRCGYFSSDRTIRGYMQDIWQVEAHAAVE